MSIFRANFQRTGVYPSKSIKHKPSLEWKFKTQGAVEASPIVYKNSVFWGSLDSTIYSVDLTNGHEKWRFITSDWGVNSSPAIVENIVYVGSKDSYLYAFDKDTGREMWKFKTDGWIFSSPTISNERIYFGSEDGYLYALK